VIALFVAAWAVVAVPLGVLTFAQTSTTTSVAGHAADVSPTFDGYATLDLGPYVPSLRYPSGRRLGVHIDVGPTHLTSYEDLIRRYAAIGAQPEGEIAKIGASLREMAVRSGLAGALAGLLAPGIWVLLGPHRRAELREQLTARRATAVGLSGVLLTVGFAQPWDGADPTLGERAGWQPVTAELPDVPVPDEVRPLEVETGLFTSGTKRLAESVLDSYTRSLAFYADLVEAVPDVADELREPGEDETVAVLVSDRHDNIGMDKVARAIGDAAGATVLLDAGDDTSTGSSWEAFSLDSLDRVFAGYEHRYSVVGNHDEGDFVGDYLDELGFTRLDGEVAKGPGDIRFFGADDPRSSGLGSWRDETGLTFDDHAELVADQVCEYDEEGDRITTLLVHDAQTGRYALQRGCVDLVVGGHVHVQLGPTEVVGENGKVGYTFTTGTTGGAAYAVAIGSKLRRNAQVSLITYREGRPVGIQPVRIRTVGDFRVGAYVELDPPPGDPDDPDGGADPGREAS
jgi:hypothetical protein